MMPLAYLRGSERNAWARPGIVFFRLPCCCCQCSRDRRRETCTKVFYMDITRIDASSVIATVKMRAKYCGDWLVLFLG